MQKIAQVILLPHRHLQRIVAEHHARPCLALVGEGAISIQMHVPVAKSALQN